MGGSSSPLPAPIKKAVNTVADTVVNVVKNPLPVVETALLTAAGVPAPAASAIVSYANGGSLKDAATSAASSYVGGQAAGEYGGEGVSPTETAAVGGAASGATRAALTGGSVSDIAKGAVKGGAVGAGTQEVASLAGTDKGTLSDSVLKEITRQTLSNVIGGKPSGSTYTPTAAAPTTSPTSVTTTGAGVSPGSSALAQALRTDLGAPIFGGDKDKESPKSGWNIESLRYTGGTGEA